MTLLIVLPALLGLVVVLLRRRARRKVRLSGTDAERPVFNVEPPRRRLSGLKGERL